MRVLSLHPVTTELLFALGAGNLLVGRTDSCAYPEAATSVPSIGALEEVTHEKMAIFEPDLIVVSYGQDELKYSLTSQWSVVQFDPQTLDDVTDQITALGAVLGKQVEADVAVHELNMVLDKVRSAIARFHIVRVYCDQVPPVVPHHLLLDLVQVAGGTLHHDDHGLDALMKFDPQIMLAISNDERSLELLATKFKNLQAVQHERLFLLDEGILRPTPRLAQGARHLAKLLHGVEVNGK